VVLERAWQAFRMHGSDHMPILAMIATMTFYAAAGRAVSGCAHL